MKQTFSELHWIGYRNVLSIEGSKTVFDREVTYKESPIILNKYANTSSTGSIITFNKYHNDLRKGDIGVICAFGAGYSVGSVILRKSN